MCLRSMARTLRSALNRPATEEPAALGAGSAALSFRSGTRPSRPRTLPRTRAARSKAHGDGWSPVLRRRRQALRTLAAPGPGTPGPWRAVRRPAVPSSSERGNVCGSTPDRRSPEQEPVHPSKAGRSHEERPERVSHVLKPSAASTSCVRAGAGSPPARGRSGPARGRSGACAGTSQGPSGP